MKYIFLEHLLYCTKNSIVGNIVSALSRQNMNSHSCADMTDVLADYRMVMVNCKW